MENSLDSSVLFTQICLMALCLSCFLTACIIRLLLKYTTRLKMSWPIPLWLYLTVILLHPLPRASNCLTLPHPFPSHQVEKAFQYHTGPHYHDCHKHSSFRKSRIWYWCEPIQWLLKMHRAADSCTVSLKGRTCLIFILCLHHLQRYRKVEYMQGLYWNLT